MSVATCIVLHIDYEKSQDVCAIPCVLLFY